MPVLDIDDLTFDEQVLRSPVPFLLDVSATWCGPCKVLAPILEQVASELGPEVRVGKLDMDASPAVSARFRVRGAPTLLLFRGGEEVGRHLGALPRERLLRFARGA